MRVNWESQKYSNIYGFTHDWYFKEKMETLREISELLNKEGVLWALSCSSALFFKGAIDDFNDYDILVAVEDAEKLLKALEGAGARLQKDSTQKGGIFGSSFYREGYFRNVHLDLVADMTVCTYGTSYCYHLREEDIEIVEVDEGFNIPICPVEANIILYGMMEGWQGRRRFKRELCRSYLKACGVLYPHILEDGLEQGLPPFLKAVVIELLEKK